ncbi:UNVERIFIED_CONTAM: hypothetical protein HDU68_007309 [Siphonaria sp. JEL0065]|nr:hypothetical protein HDU68_007309 [Siphonaria sp. JEL0065]
MPGTAVTPNPHASAIQKAVADLEALTSSTAGFTTTASETVFVKESPTTSLPIVKSHFKIQKPISLDQLLSTFQDKNARKSWDSKFDDLTVIQEYENNERLVHVLQTGTWPVVSPRDTSVIIKTIKESETKGTIVITSVEDERIPETKGRVRAHAHVVAWVFEKESAGWSLIYVAHMDPKLSGILSSAVVQRAPIVAQEFVAYIEKAF